MGHLEYVRHLLTKTEHERDSAWGNNSRLEREKNDLVNERDRLSGEKSTAETQRNEMEREKERAELERAQARDERDRAVAERDKLARLLEAADMELKNVRQERDQLLGQLKVLQNQGGGGGDEGGKATGGEQEGDMEGSEWVGRIMLELDPRRRQMLYRSQKEASELKVKKYAHYAGFAKSDMLFCSKQKLACKV